MSIARRTAPYLAPLLCCLGVGVFLGWLVLGALPGRAGPNAEPWNLRPVHQARYIGAVAGEYHETGDAERARTALAGWDREMLGEILALASLESTDAEEAGQLAALGEVLDLPEATFGWRSLLADPLVRIGLGLSSALLALTAGMTLWPSAWTSRAGEAAHLEGALAALSQLSPEEQRQLALSLHRSAGEALPEDGSASEGSWEGAAEDVDDTESERAQGERVPPPAVQLAQTAEHKPQASAAPEGKTATWQPQAPATDGRPKPPEPEPEAAQEAAPVAAQNPGPPEQAEQAQAPAPAQGKPATTDEAPAETPEEEAQEAVSLDSGLLEDLFQDEEEESMARHVLTRDLDEVDVHALLGQVEKIEHALSVVARRGEAA